MKFGKLVANADWNRIRNFLETEPIPSNANVFKRNAADYLIESGSETMASTLNHFRESILREFRQIALRAKNASRSTEISADLSRRRYGRRSIPIRLDMRAANRKNPIELMPVREIEMEIE